MQTEPLLDTYRERLLVSRTISALPSIRHGFTGRIPGVMPEEANVGYSAPRDRASAWVSRRRWASAAGMDPFTLCTVHQVHGDGVVEVDTTMIARDVEDRDAIPLGKGDALMTDVPGIGLMTLHADCLPVILVDPERPAVCAIHAGWRGTVLDIVGKAVGAMQETYGSRPESLIAAFGPGMKACCYEVGDDVADAWLATGISNAGLALADGPVKRHFDLAIASRLLLERAGILSTNIDDPGLCTSCEQDRFFSHRRQGPTTGRFGALVMIANDASEVRS